MKMRRYFNESSDMGKLYLNYPMSEAFYHLSDIPDSTYLDKFATLSELQAKKYKERVNRESKGRDYRKFIANHKECNLVIFQNLSKAWFLINNEHLEPIKFISESLQIDEIALLEIQLLHLKNRSIIYVLCTCVFYILDYNKNLLLDETII